ncbi:MAG: methyl-accepting chemotaxis protein [Janthinobacterium lividum]
MTISGTISIKNKLVILITTLIAAVLAITFISLNELHTTTRNTEVLYQQQTLPSRLSAELYRIQLIQFIALTEVLSTQDATQKQALFAQIASLSDASDRLATAFAAIRQQPDIQAAAAQFLEDRAHYAPAFLRTIDALKKGDMEEVHKMMLGDCRAYGLKLNEDISDLNRLYKDAADESHGQSVQAFHRTVAQVLAIACLGLLISVALGVMLVRYIGQALETARHAADAVAAGRLGERIAVTRHDEIGNVLGALGTMNQQLMTIVSEVRGGADRVAGASDEIATGTAMLSERTESQALAVQQTAAHVQDVTGSVDETAQKARSAKELAALAAKSAEEGHRAMRDIQKSIEKMSVSSHRVRDITGVIDGIAFQTNILALNAAVEAARAGEQGRGFAVVAAEVRTLAQRSASAAKEIAALIAESTNSVDAGVAQVADAGRRIGEVVGRVGDVSSIITDISLACEEQTKSLQSVNSSVQQIDDTAQQNAAVVEQSAAACQNLRSEAEMLRERVAYFSLPKAYA